MLITKQIKPNRRGRQAPMFGGPRRLRAASPPMAMPAAIGQFGNIFRLFLNQARD
jgi:hypothetical protein